MSDTLEYDITDLKTKPRVELRPIEMRRKEVRERFLHRVGEAHVGGDAVSQSSLCELLKIGWPTIQLYLRRNGYAIRRLKDENKEFWILINHKDKKTKKKGEVEG